MDNTAHSIDYCNSCEEILALKYYEEYGQYFCKTCMPEEKSADAVAHTPTQTLIR